MQDLTSWFSHNIETMQRLGGLWLALGLISLVLTIIALPVIVVRLPPDYFVRHKRVPVARGSRHPIVAWLVSLSKNLLGIVLIVFGAIMLFVPGQGLLTMLVGVLLMNFPGKYRLEQNIVARPSVLRTLNLIRRKAGHAPLLPPEVGRAGGMDRD